MSLLRDSVRFKCDLLGFEVERDPICMQRSKIYNVDTLYVTNMSRKFRKSRRHLGPNVSDECVMQGESVAFAFNQVRKSCSISHTYIHSVWD